jgi:hypothetical protein
VGAAVDGNAISAPIQKTADSRARRKDDILKLSVSLWNQVYSAPPPICRLWRLMLDFCCIAAELPHLPDVVSVKFALLQRTK